MDLFSLIEGMPGTGKTKVIVSLIEIFASLGLKVLVSSYTNNSLDCILGRMLSETNVEESKIIR
jgi:thymidylate kinase